MTRLRTAVIGAGKMGRLHSRIYSQMKQVDLVAVVDTELSKAQELVSEYGGKAFSDAREVIDLVDAVTISVPTESHAAVAEAFLKRAIPVLVEKPLAMSLGEAHQMLQLVQSRRAGHESPEDRTKVYGSPADLPLYVSLNGCGCRAGFDDPRY